MREVDVAHQVWTPNCRYACFDLAMLVSYNSSNPENGYRWNGLAKVITPFSLAGNNENLEGARLCSGTPRCAGLLLFKVGGGKVKLSG